MIEISLLLKFPLFEIVKYKHLEFMTSLSYQILLICIDTEIKLKIFITDYYYPYKLETVRTLLFLG